jgi:hypothetical protein
MSDIETFEELEDYLQDLNYEHGQDAAAIRTGGQGNRLYFAFCTDPDGEWFLETGDPRERLFDEEGDYPIYVPLSLGHIRTMGPYTLFHEAASNV